MALLSNGKLPSAGNSTGFAAGTLAGSARPAQLTTTAIYADAVGAEEQDIARRMWS